LVPQLRAGIRTKWSRIRNMSSGSVFVLTMIAIAVTVIARAINQK